MPTEGDTAGLHDALRHLGAGLAQAAAFEGAKADYESGLRTYGYRPETGDLVVLPRRTAGSKRDIYRVVITDVTGNGASDTVVFLRPWMDAEDDDEGNGTDGDEGRAEKWTLGDLWEWGIRPAGDAEQRAALRVWQAEQEDDPGETPAETATEKITRIDGRWGE